MPFIFQLTADGGGYLTTLPGVEQPMNSVNQVEDPASYSATAQPQARTLLTENNSSLGVNFFSISISSLPRDGHSTSMTEPKSTHPQSPITRPETCPSLYSRHIAENRLGFSRSVWNGFNDPLDSSVVTKGIVCNSDGSQETCRRGRLKTYMLHILYARCDWTHPSGS